LGQPRLGVSPDLNSKRALVSAAGHVRPSTHFAAREKKPAGGVGREEEQIETRDGMGQGDRLPA